MSSNIGNNLPITPKAVTQPLNPNTVPSKTGALPPVSTPTPSADKNVVTEGKSAIDAAALQTDPLLAAIAVSQNNQKVRQSMSGLSGEQKKEFFSSSEQQAIRQSVYSDKEAAATDTFLEKALPSLSLDTRSALKDYLAAGKLSADDRLTLLASLKGLAQTTLSASVQKAGVDGAKVLEETVQDILHPELIDQETGVTCVGASLQYDQAANDPINYVNTLRQFYSQGSLEVPGLENPLTFSLPASPPPAEVKQEKQAKQEKQEKPALTGGFMSGIFGALEDMSQQIGNKLSGFFSKITDALDSLLSGKSAVAKLQSAVIQSTFKNDKGLQKEWGALRGNVLSNTSAVFQLSTARHEGATLGTLARDGFQGRKGFYTGQGDALKAVQTALKTEKRVFAVLKGKDADHMVNIKSIKNDRVTYRDPLDRKDHVVSTAKFNQLFSAVFLPPGQGAGLKALDAADQTPVHGRGGGGGTAR